MKKIRLHYVLSLAPLVFGSTVFFLWFILRVNYATSFDIQVPGGIAIVMYLMAVLVLMLSTVHRLITKIATAKKYVIPILISVATLPAISFYDKVVYTLSERVYIRLIDDLPNAAIEDVWTANFHRWFDEDEVLSYVPVYVYSLSDDGRPIINSSFPNPAINPLFISIRFKEGMNGKPTKTIKLGAFSEGMCKTIRLSEILEK